MEESAGEVEMKPQGMQESMGDKEEIMEQLRAEQNSLGVGFPLAGKLLKEGELNEIRSGRASEGILTMPFESCWIAPLNIRIFLRLQFRPGSL